MSKESIVFTIGLLLLVIPHLGIPEVWKFYFFLIAGASLVIVGYSLRKQAYLRSIEKENGERGTDAFMEHVGQKTSTDTYV